MVAFILIALAIAVIIALIFWNKPKKISDSVIVKEAPGSSSPSKNIRISVKDMEAFHSKGIYDNVSFNDVESALLNADKYINISEERLSMLESRLKQRNGFDNDFARLSSMKSLARSYEEKKQLNEAYDAYKSLISFAHQSPYLRINNYAHDMNRFRIVSNKLKRKEEYDKFMSTLKFD